MYVRNTKQCLESINALEFWPNLVILSPKHNITWHLAWMDVNTNLIFAWLLIEGEALLFYITVIFIQLQ